jgi:hypothetical protein
VPEGPFQVYGHSIPEMIGRRAIIERLRRGLNKPKPSHMNVVGPRAAGKTVVVNALLSELSQTAKPFDGVIRWDLGHESPRSDDEFLKQLSAHVANALEGRHANWAKDLRSYGEEARDGLKEVIDMLSDEGIRVLVVLDGLEKSLASGSFTRNLWDFLAELGRKNCLRYITVSRGKPHSLVRDPASAVSDFWDIFDQTPVSIGSFDEDDLEEVISRLSDVRLDAGARTELLNWTNGFPPFVLLVLNELVERAEQRECTSTLIAAAAMRAKESVEATLNRLWCELPETAKELQRAVIQDRQTTTSKWLNRDIELLVERGFVARQGADRLHRPNKLLTQFLPSSDAADGSLRRLFGSENDYLLNARAALELRLGQLASLDTSLERSIERGLQDLPDYPENCIQNVRNIVDRALELIWSVEIPDRKIPEDWTNYWKKTGERSPEYWNGQFPTKRGHKIGLLHLLTGTENSDPVAKYITRSTYVLVSAAQGFGDFGQHIDGNTVHAATGVAAMAVCVEMAATVVRELALAGPP